MNLDLLEEVLVTGNHFVETFAWAFYVVILAAVRILTSLLSLVVTSFVLSSEVFYSLRSDESSFVLCILGKTRVNREQINVRLGWSVILQLNLLTVSLGEH